MSIIKLPRVKVKDYLAELSDSVGNKRLNLEEVVLKLHFEYLMVNPKINLVRVRVNGVDGFEATNIEGAMNQFKHWNCTWIEIID